MVNFRLEFVCFSDIEKIKSRKVQIWNEFDSLAVCVMNEDAKSFVWIANCWDINRLVNR